MGVDYNDLSLVVIQLWELKIFLESLDSEERLEEFFQENREELIENLNSMEFLLKLVYLFSEVEFFQDVPEVHHNVEAGLSIMRHFLDCLESEGHLNEFLERKTAEFDDSLNNLEYLLQLIYLFTYEAGLAIINDIRDCIDLYNWEDMIIYVMNNLAV